MVRDVYRRHSASTLLPESEWESSQRLRASLNFLPPQSVISVVAGQDSRNARMRAKSVARITLALAPPTDFNNLCGCSFGTRIAHQHAKPQRSVLRGRVYVTDSRFRS